MSFETICPQTFFAKMEEEILSFWQQNNIFERSVLERKENKRFFFYDGPPFATGLPHYGHILAGTIKDVIPRYQTMLGKKVERRFGWDCHGLPVEFEAEKELGFTQGRQEIEKMGIAKFNEYCRSIVLRYTQEWEKSVTRMGRWADLKNAYKTMDLDFMESIWWVFDSLWKQNLIYQGSKIVAYSTRLHTPVSNFEVNLNYKEVQDPSIVVSFPLCDKTNEYFLAWTTTPWTLVANLGLCVNPKINYVKIALDEKFYYLAESLVPQYFTTAKITARMSGQQLVGQAYTPLFSYFADARNQGAFRVFAGDFVSETTGTGIVHCAPMFGEDDFVIGKEHNLPQVLPLDESGYFDQSVGDLHGMYFKDADKKIIASLKQKNFLFHQTTISHRYPFCWRSDTPLIYRAIPTWFVSVQKIRQTMLDNNQQIHWTPGHIKQGRMGKWLAAARDWAISRNRYWGTPIPVWQCVACKYQESIGSCENLAKKTNQKITDLHRHFVDQLTFACPKCQKTMKRIPEILDCWFESGAMPYGQEHYPFKNKERFDKAFPADFISEGLDQTRGWFYTLLVLSNALFQKSAFKNVIVSGLLLAEDGKKMSKSLKNYPNPLELIEKYGADTIRLYLLDCVAIKGEECKFSEQLLRETSKNFFIPLWNALSFFTTYANIDSWQAQESKDLSEFINPLDLWIIAKLHQLITKIRRGMDAYDLNRSVQPFFLFINDLTNWYIRRSRRRFWKSEKETDKNQAYLCLFEVLRVLAKLLAPFAPFIAEKIYKVLSLPNEPLSVHLCEFPVANQSWACEQKTAQMDQIISVVNLGRSLRAKSQIKLRQPLSQITLIANDTQLLASIEKMSNIILEELNVKRIRFLASEERLVRFQAKLNFPLLGPRFGKKIKQVQAIINKLASKEVFAIYQGATYSFTLGTLSYKITKDDLFFSKYSSGESLIESSNEITAILDTNIDEELVAEGISRELVHLLQQERKNAGLQITDRISIEYFAHPFLTKIFASYKDYIQQETLCTRFIQLEHKTALKEFSVASKQYFFAIKKVSK